MSEPTHSEEYCAADCPCRDDERVCYCDCGEPAAGKFAGKGELGLWLCSECWERGAAEGGAPLRLVDGTGIEETKLVALSHFLDLVRS